MIRRVFQKLAEDIRGLGFKQWFLLILNAVLLLAAVASLAGLRLIGGALETTTAAERFRGTNELRFAQLACYLPVDGGKTEDDVYNFRQSLESRLVEQSLEAPEGGKLYLDAYSGSGKVTAAGETGSATVEAIGVGGNFFFFHPLHLRNGSYISSDDLMDDLVVLDEETAWRLFGSVNLAGMSVTINDEPFVVAGVIHREDDFATQRAYSGEGGIFLSFTALTRLIEDTRISCYEIVMPDPISGYAKGVVSEVFPVGNGEVVENSSRYGLKNLFAVIRSFAGRSMRLNGVIFPYWENAARLAEDCAALLLAAAILFFLCPFLFTLVTVIRYIRWGYRTVKKKIPEKVEEAVERRREERLEKEFEKKAGGE